MHEEPNELIRSGRDERVRQSKQKGLGRIFLRVSCYSISGMEGFSRLESSDD
jgi:hypothetical protein